MAAAMKLGGFRIDDLLEAREKEIQDVVEEKDIKEENEDEEEEEAEETEESESDASDQPMPQCAQEKSPITPSRTVPNLPVAPDNPLAAQNFLRIFNKMLTNRTPMANFPVQAPTRPNFMSDYLSAVQMMQQKALLATQQWPFNLHGHRPPVMPAAATSIGNFRPRIPMIHPAEASLFRPAISSGRVPRDSTPSKSNMKKYRCDICEKTFSRSNTLITHKRIHTGEKPFSCEHCGRAFRQPGNLTRHRLTHTTVKPFVCNECGKAFNRASNLHTHMKTHVTSSRMMSCFRCNKIFALKNDFRTHQCNE